MIEAAVENRIITSLSRMSLDSCIKNISLVYGDLSLRRYFRVDLEKKAEVLRKADSLIVMYFDSFDPPEAETETLKNSFDAYKELSEYLENFGYPVPEVYLYAYDLNIILQEDLGANPLINIAENRLPSIESYYKKAIDYIIDLQSIPKKEEFFPYQRGFTKEVYVQEMSEFLDFFLPADSSNTFKEDVQDSFERLGDDLNSYPLTLVHRDYHSWNLMLDQKNSLRVIDFQDALLGTRSYDLVALVRERDIDSILGEDMVKNLEKYFFQKFSDSSLKECEYPRTLLQRDLKVAGRFSKVVKTRGLMNYGRWIPGTLRRIDKTLIRLSQQEKHYERLHKCIKSFLEDPPEISYQGSQL